MRRSPLHDLNLELGARFTDFGGWEMPLRYDSVIAEHKAVRTSAGWFDVSHLGRFDLTPEWSGYPQAVPAQIGGVARAVEPCVARYRRRD